MKFRPSLIKSLSLSLQVGKGKVENLYIRLGSSNLERSYTIRSNQNPLVAILVAAAAQPC